MIAKALNQLTREEFEKLQTTGILRDIYPDSPSEYDEIEGIKPLMKTTKSIDVQKIRAACAVFMEVFDLNPLADDLWEYQQMLFEEALKAVYGDKIIEYIRYTQRIFRENEDGDTDIE